MRIPYGIDNQQHRLADVLFRCYGLSNDDAQYVEQRLKEML